MRTRQRIETGAIDVRRRVSRFGRWVYIGLLALFFLWIFDLFAGPLLRLNADGLVVAEHVSVAVPFTAQVTDVHVMPGSRVNEDDLLARVHSVDLQQSLAMLSARLADLKTRRVDIARKADVARAVLTVASHRNAESEKTIGRITDIRNGGHVSLNTWSQALNDRFDAKERMVALQAEAETAGTGLTAIDAALNKAEAAVDDLRSAYNGGLIKAPASGIIGLRTARPGDVVPVGMPMMVVYLPAPHVLAYLETGTLYTIKPGDEVEISDGFTTATGHVGEILPVADTLPEEFRKAFQPRGRSQVARIVLNDDGPFPLFAKVKLTGIGWQSPFALLRMLTIKLLAGAQSMLDSASSAQAGSSQI
ncbi:MAG: biotin/lipoyl-binding protein [Hyphomicrobiales bacterium]|nr:biotin/lipoyl-binding protein [Hyphomicrobiales bacterium]